MLTIRSILIFSLILAAGIGCQNTYNQTTTEAQPGAAPLRSNTRVYVSMPEDAMDKKDTVASSGRRTMLAVEAAFKRQTKGVITARIPETREECIHRARALGCEYVAFSTILKWQDRPTEWTAVRDKLDLKVELIAADSGETVRSTTVQAKSKVMSDGDGAPQDLLADPVDKFVRSLFRLTYTPSALQK